MSSEKWEMVLARLQKPDGLVIVDAASPEMADAQTLASKVDAIVLIVRAGQTPAESARATLRRFQSAKATVLGAILYRAHEVQSVRSQLSSWTKMRQRRKEEPSAGNGMIGETSTPPS
jgi:Mrp family chromosome partitioning ATPase